MQPRWQCVRTMMRVAIALTCALVGACVAGVAGVAGYDWDIIPVWQPGVMYKYEVHTRTVVGLTPPPTQLNGVVTRAVLLIQTDPRAPRLLKVRVKEAQFSRLHTRVPGAWDAPLPSKELRWRALPLRHRLFALRLRGGQVYRFLIQQNSPLRDINIMRAWAGALQFTLSQGAENGGSKGELKSNTVLEESPMGTCATQYDVSVLPSYVVQSTPSLAPVLASNTNNDTQFLEIVKTIDFDKCTQTLPLEWISGGSDKSYERGPVTRASTTRAVFGGRPGNFEIQSVTATSRIAAGTLLRGDGRESVAWGGVNITLVSKDEHPRHDLPLLRYAMNASLIVNGPMGSNKDLYGSSQPSALVNKVKWRPESSSMNADGEAGENSSSSSDDGGGADADKDVPSQSFSYAGDTESHTGRLSTLSPQVIEENLSGTEWIRARYVRPMFPAYSTLPKTGAGSESVLWQERQYYELRMPKPNEDLLTADAKRSNSFLRNAALDGELEEGSEYSILKEKSGYYLILENILDMADKHPEEMSSHIRSILEINGAFTTKSATADADEDQPSNSPSPGVRKRANEKMQWHANSYPMPPYSFLHYLFNLADTSPGRVIKASGILSIVEQENSESEWEDGPLQVSAEEQRYRDKLDFQTMLALATDPEFSGAKEFCPKLVIVHAALHVASDVSHPGQLVRRRALLRWAELARMVRGCTQAALTGIGAALQQADTPRGRSAWKAFRDATAAAGTGASLVALSVWLRAGAVQGWEARQLLATVRGAAREPTLDYLKYFQKYIAWQHDIKKMEGINTTAILTYGSLIYDVHNRYSDVTLLHMVSDFISEMYDASINGDHLKLQVFARGLGMTGNQAVPHVFTPYLQGSAPNITTYTRVALVVAMQRAAMLHSENTRRVLFNLYENEAEAYEVRVAAVYILMCSNPPLDVLQRMAATAHLDPSNQVSAAVRTVLQVTAQLELPQQRQLARNARAVLHTLLRRTQSLHYSRSYVKDYFVNGEKGLGYSLVFNYIGSYDSIIPKTVYFGLNSYLGGLKLDSSELGIVLSSIRKLMSTFSDLNLYILERAQLKESDPEPKLPKGPYSWRGVTNFGPRIDEPLEGHIYFPSPGGPQFVNFNQDTVVRTTTGLAIAAVGFLFGEDFYNSKLFYGPRYSFSVPDITGHITFFNIDDINILRAFVNVSNVRQPVTSRKQFSSRQGDNIMDGLNFDMNFANANTMMSRLGFVCFYDREPQRILAAYDQEYMFNIPINLTAGMYSDEDQVSHYILSLKSLSDENQTLLHFKGTPYTARQSPDAQGPGHEKEAFLVSARDQQERFGNLGPHGMFRFNLTSEAEFLDAVEGAKGLAGYDPVAFLFLPVVRPQLEPLEGTLTFDPSETKFKVIDFDVYFAADEGEDPLKPSPGSRQRTPTHSQTSDFRYRNQKMEIGMFISFYDKFISHILRNEYNADFRRKNESVRLHYIYEESADDQKSENALRRKFEQEWHLAVNSQWGDAPRWIFDEALAANPRSTVSAKLSYVDSMQKKMDIDIQCILRRTSERVLYLKSHRTASLCREQMERGDLFQPACLNVTLRAGYLDHYRCEAEFDRLEPAFINLTAAAYAQARHMFEPHVHENPLHRGEVGRATADVHFKAGFHAVDVALSGPAFAAQFENLRMTRQVRPFVVVHPEYDFRQRVAQYLFVYQNEPKCVLDKTTVNTFDNTTYNIHLGPCWHNMSILTMQHVGNMTIQVRDSDEDRILRILLPEGSELELRKSIRTARVSESERSAPLYINGNLVEISQDSPLSLDVQYRDVHDIVELSLITGNLFLVNMKNYRVRIFYDGVRILVYAPNDFRAQVRGLCGTFTGEPHDDFRDPDGLFQRDSRLFAASYADVRHQCEGPAKSDNALSKQVPRFPEEILLFNVGGLEYFRSTEESLEQPERRCTWKYVDVVRNGSADCFSQMSLPKCAGSCQASGYDSVSVRYHCVTGGAARFWKSLIDRGSIPDFSRKATSNVLTKKVPKACVPRASEPRSMMGSIPKW